MGPMPKLGPSLNPQVVKRDRAWYYESARGIELITQIRDKNGTFISGDVTRIPWSQILRSAARCGKIASNEGRAKLRRYGARND